MTNSIAATDFINIVLTLGIVVIAWESRRIATRVQWLTGAMERHSDQQRQIAAKEAGIQMIWWDPNEGGRFPHKGKHEHMHRLEKIYIGIPEHLRKPDRWLPGPGARLTTVCGIAGVILLALFRGVYPVTIDSLEWHGDVMGVGFLLVGFAIGALLRARP